MQSSMSEFSRSEFLEDLRNNQDNFYDYLAEVSNLNMVWIHEMILQTYKFIVDSKQSPSAKLTALNCLKQIMQTCEIPCLVLMEVYIAPVLFDIANQKPTHKQGKKGYRFFIDDGYSYRIHSIEQTGMKFVKLATQILFVLGTIKTKRTINNQQLQQQSVGVAMFQRLRDLKVLQLPQKIQDLTLFQVNQVEKYKSKYRKKLAEFESVSQIYTKFYVFKIVESLQTQRNSLFSAKTGQLYLDLDMRKFLKYGDTYITSPLIQQIIDGIKISQNMIIKRNFLALFSDLIKWADVEAIVGVIFDEFIDDLAVRIAEVNGQEGLEEGQKIFKEIKGQRQAKKKFYIQFLKCIELWRVLFQSNPFYEDEGKLKMQQFYQYFKIDRNFIFPINIMTDKLQEQFIKSMHHNSERNQKLIQKLKLESNSTINKSSYNKKKSFQEKLSDHRQKSSIKKSFSGIKENFDQCLRTLVNLCDDEELLQEKIQVLVRFREQFDGDMENIQDIENQGEFLQMLDDGDALISNINAMENLYDQYSKGKISFKQFCEQSEKRMEIIQKKADNSKQECSIKRQSSFIKKSSKLQSKIQKQQNSNLYIQGNPQHSAITEQIQPSLSHKSHIKDHNSQFSHISEKSDKQQKIQQNPSGIDNYQGSISANFVGDISQSRNEYYSIHNSQFPPNQHEYTFNQNTLKNKLLKINQSSNQSSHTEFYSFQGRDLQRQTTQLAIQYYVDSDNQNQIRNRDNNKIVDSKPTLPKIANILQQQPPQYTYKSNNSNIEKSKSPNNSQNAGKSSIISSSKFKSTIKPSDIQINSCYTRPKTRRNRQKQISSLKSQKSQEYCEKNVGNSQLSVSSRTQVKNVNGKQYTIINNGQIQNIRLAQSINDNHPMISEYFMVPLQNSTLSKNKQPQNYSNKPITPIIPIIPIIPTVPISHSIITPSTNNTPYYIQTQQQLQNYKSHIKQVQQISQQQQSHSSNNNYQISIQKSKSLTLSHLQPNKTNQTVVRKNRMKNLPELEYMTLKEYRLTNMKDEDILKMEKKIVKLRRQSYEIRKELSMRNSFNRSRENSVGSSGYQQFRSTRSFSRSSFQSHQSYQSQPSYSLKNIYDQKSKIGKQIDYSKYQPYFTNYTNDNILKNTLIKSKGRITKIDEVEFGYVVKLENINKCKLALYLTADKYLGDFTYQLVYGSQLVIKGYPERFQYIPENKQIRINFLIEIKSYPYKLPSIKLSYNTNQQQKSHATLQLPVSINKFCHFSTLPLTEYSQNSQSITLTTKFFKINRKLIKNQKIKEYIGNLTEYRISDDEVDYQTKCSFNHMDFLLKFVTIGKYYMEIQAIIDDSSITQMTALYQSLQFLLASYKSIFAHETQI